MVTLLTNFWQTTGFANMTWQEMVMLAVAGILLYLAIGKAFEPLLLVPIAFGMLLTNLPMSGVMEIGDTVLRAISPEAAGETARMLGGTNSRDVAGRDSC